MNYSPTEITKYAMELYKIDDSKEKSLYQDVLKSLKQLGSNGSSYWDIAWKNKKGKSKRSFDERTRDEVVLHLHDRLRKASSDSSIVGMVSAEESGPDNDERRRKRAFDAEISILEGQIREQTQGMSDEDALEYINNAYNKIEEKYDIHPDYKEYPAEMHCAPSPDGWRDYLIENILKCSLGIDLQRFRDDWSLVYRCDYLNGDLTPDYVFAKKKIQEFDYYAPRLEGANGVRICKEDKEEISNAVIEFFKEFFTSDEFIDAVNDRLLKPQSSKEKQTK